jgi:hypothetical protein
MMVVMVMVMVMMVMMMMSEPTTGVHRVHRRP